MNTRLDITWDAVVSSGQTATATFGYLNDYLAFEVSASSGAKTSYIQNTVNLQLGTTIYQKSRVRFKCSNNTIKAKVLAVYSDTSESVILAEQNSESFLVVSTELDPAKILDHLRISANGGTGTVYYDFIQIYKGDLEIAAPVHVEPVLTVEDSILKPLNFAGALSNANGAEPVEFTVSFDMTIGKFRRSTELGDPVNDTIDGQIFYELANQSGVSVDEWFWFKSDLENMKVRLVSASFPRTVNNSEILWTADIKLREYRQSSGTNTLETYVSRYGLDLTYATS
jgi:hypothetical protein